VTFSPGGTLPKLPRRGQEVSGREARRPLQGANVTKLFTVVIYDWDKRARLLGPSMSFQPSLKFASLAEGTLLALPSNTGLSWKGLPGANTRVGGNQPI